MNQRIREAIPHLITFTTLALGMCSIAFAIEGKLAVAGILILTGYLLDAVDGEIARKLGVNSDFGIHLDSLVDIVNFGGATAILVRQHLAETLAFDWPIWLLGVAFVLSGAFRLARFNLTAGDGKRHETIGLTISTAGAFMTLAVLADQTNQHRLIPDALFLPMLLAISLLMVSRIRFPELKAILAKRGPALAILTTGAVVSIWLTPQVVWFWITSGYISFGLLRAAAQLVT